MSNEKIDKITKTMIDFYFAIKYFDIMYDVTLARIKLMMAFADPNNRKEVEKCIDMPVKDAEKWHCIFRVIGAEDLWEKYNGVWKKVV